MNYLRRRREILGGFGGTLPREILKIWASQDPFQAFWSKNQGIWTEHETQIVAEITQNSGKVLLIFMNKSWPIQGSSLVANVSHVSCKI